MSLLQEDIKQKLIDWLINTVEQPNPLLLGWPMCPYARTARINNRIEIRFSSLDFLENDVYNSLSVLDQDKEVIVICFDHTLISPEFLQDFVIRLNKNLMPKNYVILEDHPDLKEVIAGVTMNFGYCGLLIISKLDMLNSASDQLRSKGYYNAWSQDDLDNVVTWRYKNEIL